MGKALIIVDMQWDFMEGGRLGVPFAGEALVVAINNYMEKEKFDTVVATQDWHPADHCSFETNGGTWPVHCVQGTTGAELHRNLNLRPVNLILRKGMNPKMDSYSAFLENDKKTETGLWGYLATKRFSHQEVHIVGLARDYCVRWTAEDALLLSPAKVVVVRDLTRSVYMENDEVLLKELVAKGIKVL